jgi:prophage antirepressor-like protein
MAATAIQPTTTVSFRASGSKPSPVQVFVKAGQKWIVASEVCRILGIRTDSVPQLIPEKDRSRAAVLTKGSVQSVTTITEAGFNLLVAQSAKPAAKKGAARVDGGRGAALDPEASGAEGSAGAGGFLLMRATGL